jgi:hypothetical protein
VGVIGRAMQECSVGKIAKTDRWDCIDISGDLPTVRIESVVVGTAWVKSPLNSEHVALPSTAILPNSTALRAARITPAISRGPENSLIAQATKV